MNFALGSGAVVRPELQHWHEILLRWCAIVEQHCRISPNQRPWWDTEVAQAGLLSSAAIQCGYASLVESSGTKAGAGRSDLWVQFGPDTEDGASQEFLELKRHKDPLTVQNCVVATEMLDAAVSDARIVSLKSRSKIGACIYSVVSSSSELNSLKSVCDRIEAACRPNAMAWVFPACVRNAPGTDGRLWPGCVLAMRRVGSATDLV